MRERLVAWAEDCRVRGEVDLGDGRLSDEVNERESLTFFGATLEAIEDGREVRLDELEVARRELSLIEVEGRRGDPARRLRTVEERVYLEVGPFTVTGNLHRPPAAPALAALHRWSRFLPVTDATLELAARPGEPRRLEVLLVNRDRIHKSEPLAAHVTSPNEPVDGGAAAGAPG